VLVVVLVAVMAVVLVRVAVAVVAMMVVVAVVAMMVVVVGMWILGFLCFDLALVDVRSPALHVVVGLFFFHVL
jgi:hypothetical protein